MDQKKQQTYNHQKHLISGTEISKIIYGEKKASGGGGALVVLTYRYYKKFKSFPVASTA